MPPSLSSGENSISQWITTTTDHMTHVKDHTFLPHGERTSIKDHISPTLASGQWLTVNSTIWFKISPLSITPDTMTVTCLWVWVCYLWLLVTMLSPAVDGLEMCLTRFSSLWLLWSICRMYSGSLVTSITRASSPARRAAIPPATSWGIFSLILHINVEGWYWLSLHPSTLTYNQTIHIHKTVVSYLFCPNQTQHGTHHQD